MKTLRFSKKLRAKASKDPKVAGRLEEIAKSLVTYNTAPVVKHKPDPRKLARRAKLNKKTVSRKANSLYLVRGEAHPFASDKGPNRKHLRSALRGPRTPQPHNPQYKNRDKATT